MNPTLSNSTTQPFKNILFGSAFVMDDTIMPCVFLKVGKRKALQIRVRNAVQGEAGWLADGVQITGKVKIKSRTVCTPIVIDHVRPAGPTPMVPVHTPEFEQGVAAVAAKRARRRAGDPVSHAEAVGTAIGKAMALVPTPVQKKTARKSTKKTK